MRFPKAIISPQGEAIYRLLLHGKIHTASSIGKELGILPHAVYRSIKPLISLGLVEELETYPTSFQKVSIESAMNAYLLELRNGFLEKFFAKKSFAQIPSSLLDVTFIHNRDEFLEHCRDDIREAKKEVHHLVSGLEVPAESMLAFHNAANRGVSMKFLVQRLDEVNRETLLQIRKSGIEIRHFPSLEVRIVTVDQRIAYITSYNPQKRNEAIGVRFNYPPIARLMDDLFLQRWYLGKEINKASVKE